MNCVINPITGRAVKIDSPAGRRALKYASKNNLETSHDCIINPKTGRAVRKDSPTGQKLMKQFKKNENYIPSMPNDDFSFGSVSKPTSMDYFNSKTKTPKPKKPKQTKPKMPKMPKPKK